MPEVAQGTPRFSKNKSKAQTVMEMRAQMFRERARPPRVTNTTGIRSHSNRRGQRDQTENSTGTIEEDFHSFEFSQENSTGTVTGNGNGTGTVTNKHNDNSLSLSLSPIQEISTYGVSNGNNKTNSNNSNTNGILNSSDSGHMNIERGNQMEYIDHSNISSNITTLPVSGRNSSNSNSFNYTPNNSGKNNASTNANANAKSIIMSKYSCNV